MTVTVRLFAGLRKKLPPGSPRGHCELEVPPGVTVGALLDHLGITRKEAQMVLVNGVHGREFERRLQDGDVVSVFPPVAGG